MVKQHYKPFSYDKAFEKLEEDLVKVDLMLAEKEKEVAAEKVVEFIMPQAIEEAYLFKAKNKARAEGVLSMMKEEINTRAGKKKITDAKEMEAFGCKFLSEKKGPIGSVAKKYIKDNDIDIEYGAIKKDPTEPVVPSKVVAEPTVDDKKLPDKTTSQPAATVDPVIAATVATVATAAAVDSNKKPAVDTAQPKPADIPPSLDSKDKSQDKLDKNKEGTLDTTVKTRPAKNEAEPTAGSAKLIEEEKEIRRTELANLQTAVEMARRGYTTKDYEVSTVFSKIKKIFGGHLHSSSTDNQETKDQYEAYQRALQNLLEFQISDLKEKNLPPEKLDAEIDRLTKYYNQDEKINLYGSRTDARAEALERKYGRAPGWIAEKGAKFVNWYRKLNWKTKMVFGMASTLTGAGLLMAGQRVLGGTAAGVGVTASLEARYRRKEKMQLDEEQFILGEDLKRIEDPEEKYGALMARMQEEMAGYEDSLKNERAKARKRKLIGGFVGVFIGTGAMSHLIKWGYVAHDYYFGQDVAVPAHVNESILNNSSHGASGDYSALQKTAPTHGIEHDKLIKTVPETIPDANSNIPSAAAPAPEAAHNIISDNSNVHSEVAATPEVVVAQSTGFAGVEIAQKGDSAWKMVAKHFEHNSEFESLQPEQKTYVIDALKDRINSLHETFNIKDIDNIKIGQEIDFSKVVDNDADFHSVVEHAKHLTAAQLKNIGNNNRAILDWVEAHPGQALTSSGVEQILSDTPDVPASSFSHAVATLPDQSASPSAMDMHDIHGSHESIPLSNDIDMITGNHVLPAETIPSPKAHSGVPVESKLPVTGDYVSSNETVSSPESHIDAPLGRKIPVVEMSDSVTDKIDDASLAVGAGVAAAAVGAKIVKDKVIDFPNAAERVARRKEKVALGAPKEFKKLAKEYGLVSGEEFDDRGGKLIKKLAIDSREIWGLMGVARFSGWEEGAPIKLITESDKKLTKRLTLNIQRLVESMYKYLGDAARPRRGEKVMTWLARVTDISLKEEKLSELKKAA